MTLRDLSNIKLKRRFWLHFALKVHQKDEDSVIIYSALRADGKSGDVAVFSETTDVEGLVLKPKKIR